MGFELIAVDAQHTRERTLVPTTAQSIYEQTLIVRGQLGDEASCREILRLHAPGLLSFIRKMLAGMPERVEDIEQEVWIAIFRGLPSLLEVTKFRPWAFRIARDRVYREYRRRRVAVESTEEVEVEGMAEDEKAEPAVDPADLQRCLDSISPGHREVLLLRFFEEMGYEEIARVTNSSLGTVRSRLHYAKRALRAAIAQTLYEQETN